MRYIRDIWRVVLPVVMLTAVLQAHAQDVTYNHDSSVMNQFTVGETGVGGLTPDWYYSAIHNSYRKDAGARNKLLFRTHMKLALAPQEGYAENIDSALNDRKRVEFLNIADRTPGVTDMAWQVEKGKIESKLAIFKKNIESLTVEGAPASDYLIWMERYNCINCGLQAVRDAYMPQGERKEEYITIYRDILAKNTEVCEYIGLLRQLREVKNISDNPRPLPKTQFGKVARAAHGRWKVAMATGSGGGGSK